MVARESLVVVKQMSGLFRVSCLPHPEMALQVLDFLREIRH